MALTRREYSRYRPWWGGSSTRPGHFFLACQMVSAVWMPSRLAGSFLARMIPWREAGSPQTAVGMSRRSGWLSSSTEAKKQFRSQCKITRSPMRHTSLDSIVCSIISWLAPSHKRKTQSPERTEDCVSGLRMLFVQQGGQGLVDEEADAHIQQPLAQGKGNVEHH